MIIPCLVLLACCEFGIYAAEQSKNGAQGTYMYYISQRCLRRPHSNSWPIAERERCSSRVGDRYCLHVSAGDDTKTVEKLAHMVLEDRDDAKKDE
jgi:hypothetical protein